MKKRLLAVIAFLVLTFVFAGCGSADSAANDTTASEDKASAATVENDTTAEVDAKVTPSDEEVVIRVGYHYSSPYEVALAIAKEKGFFDEAFADYNVTVEYTGFVGAGPAINEAFLAGELDVAHGLGDQPAISGIANGNNGVIVSRTVRNTQGSGIIVKYDSDIESVADLKGKTVAVGLGQAGQKCLDLILEDYGLSEDDVSLVNIYQYDEIVAAFERDEIDAALNSSLAFTLAADEANKTFRLLIDFSTHPNFAYLQFQKEFTEKYPDITYKFIEALYKAIAWYYDGNIEEGDQITAEFLELTEPDDYERVVQGDSAMELDLDFTEEDVQNIQDTYDFLERLDILPDEIEDLSAAYDDRFIKKVIENNQ